MYLHIQCMESLCMYIYIYIYIYMYMSCRSVKSFFSSIVKTAYAKRRTLASHNVIQFFFLRTNIYYHAVINISLL